MLTPFLSRFVALMMGIWQRKLYHWSFFTFVLVSGLFFSSSMLSAQTVQNQDGVALAMVIDNSGSMDGNDPNDWRYAATRLIMDVGDDWDEVGVICFGDTSSTMKPLAALGPTNNRSTQTASITKSNCASSGGTVMVTAIQEGITQLQTSNAARKYLLILTDGAPSDNPVPAVEDALKQGITVVPVELGLNIQFLSSLGISSRSINGANELLSTFAGIYSELKPDRYVEVLDTTTPNLNVDQIQQVNRLDLVLSPNQSIIDNGTNRTCPGDPECQPDAAQQQYYLLPVMQSPVQGSWQVAPGGMIVVIARSNFRPALAYPPADDPTQIGYFLPRGSSQTLIARISTPSNMLGSMSINGQSGGIALDDQQQTLLFEQFSGEQSQAAIQLGTGTQPLQVVKTFSLAPVPNQEPDLPQLVAVNPDSQGQIQTEPNGQARLIVNLEGNMGLIQSSTLSALVIDTNTGQVVYGPQALQANGNSYQSQSLIDIQPGTAYRTLFWLNAVRTADALRYGDQLDLQVQTTGTIRVQMQNLTLADFHKGQIPITVEVTEPDRRVDLTARLEWTDQPRSGLAEGLFRVSLQESSFVNKQDSTLHVTGPSVLCADLEPGQYTGKLVFQSSSGLPVTPAEVPVLETLRCGGVQISGLPSELSLAILQTTVPLTVSVEDIGRTIDLQARIEWENLSPDVAMRLNNVKVDLAQDQFTGSTTTVLQPDGRIDLCTLPETAYRGTLIFSSNTDIPITPERIPIEGSNLFGAVHLPNPQTVDLGGYCTLPGWFDLLCFHVFGEDQRKTADIPIELPVCATVDQVELQVTSATPQDTPELQFGAINRLTQPNTALLQFTNKPSPLLFTLGNLNTHQDITANIIVQRENQAEQPDALQVTYTKYSWLNAIWPFWFEGPWRAGNCVSVIVVALFLLWFFGVGRRRRRRSDSRRSERSSERSGSGATSRSSERSGSGATSRSSQHSTSRSRQRK